MQQTLSLVGSRKCWTIGLVATTLLALLASGGPFVLKKYEEHMVREGLKLMGCVDKQFRTPGEWEMFDLEAVFKGRTNFTFDDVLTEYVQFHLRTSAAPLSKEIASPILLYRNNYNGFGNRQLAFASMLLYSILTSRVLIHDWSDPFEDRLFYSSHAHPVLEVVSFSRSEFFLKSITERRVLNPDWRACVEAEPRRFIASQLGAAEKEEVGLLEIDGWTCSGPYKDVVEALVNDMAQDGTRLAVTKRNNAFFKKHFGQEQVLAGHGWVGGSVLPLAMQPSLTVRRVVDVMHAPFQPGEVKICAGLRVGSKKNSHNEKIDTSRVPFFYSQCIQRYVAHIRTTSNRTARVFVVSDNVEMRGEVVDKLEQDGIPAFANAEYPVHASMANVDKLKEKTTCDLSRGMLITAAEQLALARCDITLGSTSSTFHLAAMYSRLREPWLGLQAVDNGRWTNFDRQLRSQIYPSLQHSDLPANLCEDIQGPGTLPPRNKLW